MRAGSSWRVRVGLLSALFAAELLWLITRYEVPELPTPLTARPIGSVGLFHASKELWQVALWIAGSCLLTLTPSVKGIAESLRQDSRGYRWPHALGLHALAFVTFVVLTALIFDRPTDPARLSATWFTGWLLLAGLTLLSWLLAIAPHHSWLRLLQRERSGLLVGALLGVGVWMLIGMLVRQEAPLAQVSLWNTLSGATLRVVHALLGLVYGDLVYQPDQLLVGTAAFPVEVTYACSGIEGISLISVFLGVYLWLFRGQLRFPQAFWLLPLGMAAAWLANAVRIALLVAIGTSVSAQAALQGFHAQAGWVAFTAIAIGAIALSHQLRFFSIARSSDSAAVETDPPAVALLAPLLVLLAISIVTPTTVGGFDWFYPVRVAATGAVLWHFRNAYRGLGWTWSWQALAIGVAVFVIWMLLEPPTHGSDVALPQVGWVSALWLISRVLGSTIVVPLAEELAFRGYLMRKLIKADFENVALTHLTWVSFVASSALFGLLHGRWLAGTLAGMAYALAVYRRGQLGDAVAAHATTNALLAAWVITQGSFHLWSRIAS